MANLSTNVLILFAISAALAFFFPLFKDGVFKELSFKPLVKALIPFAIVMVPFAALFGLGAYLGLAVNVTLPCFLAAAFLSLLISRIGLTGPLRGVLLLVAGVIFTSCLPNDALAPAVSAAILGLLAAKLTDNALFSEKQIYDDIVPPVAWLGGVLWLAVSGPETSENHRSLLLSIISICLLLRVMQRPFMTDDRWLLKRIILAATGGLAVLLVITKLLLTVDQAPLAWLVGGSMFATYLFQNIDAEGEDKITAAAGIQMLIVIGVLTLVAERFFGMFGLLAMVPAAILPPRSGLAQYAGLFFLSRVLLQGFVLSFNSNVTGINLTHAYTGAALYAGFIVIAVLFMLLREVTDRRILCGMFLISGAVIPTAANFYLHAEPTSSLLVAATVAAVMFACLGPALQRNPASGYGNLLLVPSMMAVAGITYGGLIETGVSANNETRLSILAGAAVLVVICIIANWLSSRQPKKPTPVAES